MTLLITSFLDLIREHSLLTYVLLFLVGFLESLVVVGLIIPGSLMLIGLGAILAMGALPWVPTFTMVVLGAILGDFASYWIGCIYRHSISDLWPFSRYPEMISYGQRYFERHGGKSIFLGRFVHVIRPMIPLIAGMMNMPKGQFFLWNALSAIGWVIVYTIPGYILGGSLMVSSSVAARIGFWLSVVAICLWVALWFLTLMFSWFLKLDKKNAARVKTIAMLFFFGVWLFLCVTRIVRLGFLERADHETFQFLTSIRFGLADQILITVTELGDARVNFFIIMAVLMALLLYKKFRAACFWLLATVGAAILGQSLKWAVKHPRPIEIYEGLTRYSFPSGHAVMNVVIFGFFAIMLKASLNRYWRLFSLTIALLIALVISFSRIYLGAHWLTDVVGGLSLGLAWIMLIARFYDKEEAKLPICPLLVALGLALIIGGGLHAFMSHTQDVERYQPHAHGEQTRQMN